MVEEVTQGTTAEFEEALRTLVVALDRDPHCLEAQLIAFPVDEQRKVVCLTAKLAGRTDLDEFMTRGLPACRKRLPVLWSSLRRPIGFRMTTEAA
jgi:hypothetical protein